MANRQLAFGTISFAVCFAAWGLISAFAAHFRCRIFDETIHYLAFKPLLTGQAQADNANIRFAIFQSQRDIFQILG